MAIWPKKISPTITRNWNFFAKKIIFPKLTLPWLGNYHGLLNPEVQVFGSQGVVSRVFPIRVIGHWLITAQYIYDQRLRFLHRSTGCLCLLVLRETTESSKHRGWEGASFYPPPVFATLCTLTQNQLFQFSLVVIFR